MRQRSGLWLTGKSDAKRLRNGSGEQASRLVSVQAQPAADIVDSLIRSERGSRETRGALGANHPVLADFKVVMGHSISSRRRASRSHAVGCKKRLPSRLRAEKIFAKRMGEDESRRG